MIPGIRPLKYVLLIVLICSFFLRAAVAKETPDPTTQLQPILKQITQLLVEQKTAQSENLVEQVMAIAQSSFDFREMSKRALGKQWRKLSPQQQDEFVELFTQLLQHVYVSQVDQYSGQTIEFTGQRIRGKRAEVQTNVIDRQLQIPVSYIMLLKGEQWMIYDVMIEGVSLIRNYLEQFREIIRKDGYRGLSNQLEQKIAAYKKNPPGQLKVTL